MMNIPENVEKLERIIEGGFIKTVYQPIVSFTDGQVFGYEALSRISRPELDMNIEDMFILADRMGKTWELETLCRTRALEKFGCVSGKKLFINVNPNVIHDENFKEGFTKKKLDELGISSDSIIIEITERASILNAKMFFDSIHHYKSQNYGIAIDDVGSGFSGLNIILDVKPNFIKLDRHIIRNIDQDETKLLLCKALVNFCEGAGILLIAEGIESENELRALIRLGVHYGQGFFLGIPQYDFKEIAQDKATLISTCHSKHYKEKVRSSIYPTIEHLCRRGQVFSSGEKVENIYEMLRLNPTIMDFAVVDDDKTVGFMTRADLNSVLGGHYGYSLNSKKCIAQLIRQDFLKVNYQMTVDQLSRLAMQRIHGQLYDPIVVEKDGQYLGIITVKDLLDVATKIEIDEALHASPLTGLPGNLLIEKEIVERILGDRSYCITYYDLDNFKAYNDAYGFENGDLMLKLVAETLQKCALKDEFVGHIGGDDFIVIGDYADGNDYCEAVIELFSAQAPSLYREEDVKKGYIVSKNRNGVTEEFPIVSLSIAGVTSRQKRYKNIGDFSRDVAVLKKISKKQPGNCYNLI